MRIRLEDVSAELPPLPVPTARDRAERPVELVEGTLCDVLGIELGQRHQLRHDRDALVRRRSDENTGSDHPPLVESRLDPVDQLLPRRQLLEADPSPVALDLRDDEHVGFARSGLVFLRRRDACDAGELGSHLAGELLVVLRGHCAVSGAQCDRPANLRVRDVLAVGAARGTPPVLDRCDARDRRAHHPEDPVGDVPSFTATGQVLAQP